MNTNNENTRTDALQRVSTTDQISAQPGGDAINGVKRGLLQGMAIALGFFGTTVFAVAISGTIKTWTSGEVLKSADLNTTISSMKTAIEGIPNWTKAANGNDAYYTAGNVGIGTTSPSVLLHGFSSANADAGFLVETSSSLGVSRIQLKASSRMWGISVEGTGYANSGKFNIYDYTASQYRMSIDSVGNLGIGTTTPSQTLTVNGNAGNTTGVWVNNSDERLKKNIQPLGSYLDKLTELRPVTFEWKDAKKLNAKEGKHIGFIAQEVEKVFPYWVDTDKDGMKWLSMEGVNAAFVQSFKEVALRLRSGNDSVSAIAQKIESLEKEKAANEKKISALEADNKRLHELVETLNASVGTHGRASLRRMEDRLNALEKMQIATAAQGARK